MASLHITKAHPNSAGKDKPWWGAPTNEKLNEEWVEFRNITVSKLRLVGVSLHHNTFDSNCRNTGESQLTTFTGELESATAFACTPVPTKIASMAMFTTFTSAGRILFGTTAVATAWSCA